jgi:hypothetical protein
MKTDGSPRKMPPCRSELIITPEGEVIIVNMTAELLELAHDLSPGNINITRRWLRKNSLTEKAQ